MSATGSSPNDLQILKFVIANLKRRIPRRASTGKGATVALMLFSIDMSCCCAACDGSSVSSSGPSALPSREVPATQPLERSNANKSLLLRRKHRRAVVKTRIQGLQHEVLLKRSNLVTGRHAQWTVGKAIQPGNSKECAR